jgi:hypothetical protein
VCGVVFAISLPYVPSMITKLFELKLLLTIFLLAFCHFLINYLQNILYYGCNNMEGTPLQNIRHTFSFYIHVLRKDNWINLLYLQRHDFPHGEKYVTNICYRFSFFVYLSLHLCISRQNICIHMMYHMCNKIETLYCILYECSTRHIFVSIVVLHAQPVGFV